MTSFETITLDDYKELVNNEKKIFDLTDNFTTPEILNKYRYSDKNIDKKIKEKEKYDNLDKIINKSIDKLKNKPKRDFSANYDYDYDNSISILDKTKYDYDDIILKTYGQNYRFDNDDEILNSF